MPTALLNMANIVCACCSHKPASWFLIDGKGMLPGTLTMGTHPAHALLNIVRCHAGRPNANMDVLLDMRI